MDESSTQITPAWVSGALSVTLPASARINHPRTSFSGITTDSRKIAPGSIFLALKGDRFDGHEFIGQAIEQGATGIICRRGTPLPESPRAAQALIFQVDDTLEAYRKLAGAWRRRFEIPVIGVGGSVGKTTTKELLASLLHAKWANLLKTQGSQNGFVGIPMTLLELEPAHHAAVIEIGIDEIGAMEKHCSLVSPTAAVLTTIGPEHLEKLVDVPTVAREEGLLLQQTAKLGGTVVINLDDPWIRPFFVTLKNAQRFGFSMAPQGPSSENVLHGRLQDHGATLEVDGMGFHHTHLKLPLPGAHNAQNLLAAICTARAIGLNPEETQAGLKTFRGAPGRSELKELPGPTPVVCDYYNANPSSVEAGLNMLQQVATMPRGALRTRFVCLGDMLELGPAEEAFHRGLAERILTLKIEHVFLLGKRMRWLHDELQSRQYAGDLRHFDSHADLSHALLGSAHPGDAILLKGSRGIKMEEIWKSLEPFAQNNWKKA